jgi:hypothetical protein
MRDVIGRHVTFSLSMMPKMAMAWRHLCRESHSRWARNSKNWISLSCHRSSMIFAVPLPGAFQHWTLGRPETITIVNRLSGGGECSNPMAGRGQLLILHRDDKDVCSVSCKPFPLPLSLKFDPSQPRLMSFVPRDSFSPPTRAAAFPRLLIGTETPRCLQDTTSLDLAD